MHIPVSKQHRHIHSSEDEDDMEPGILKDVTKGGTISKRSVHYNGYQNAHHHANHRRRHRHRHQVQKVEWPWESICIAVLYGSMTCLPGFNSGKECLIPRRLCTTRLAAHNTNFMGITVIGQVNLAIALFAHQGAALCGSTCGGICDSNERQCSTEDQGRGACAARRAGVEGVAHLMRMIANGRHNEVRAINSNHTALSEP